MVIKLGKVVEVPKQAAVFETANTSDARTDLTQMIWSRKNCNVSSAI